MNNSIIFEEKSECGLIYLNRPKALNALDLEMTDLFYKKLNDWKNNIKIKRVLIKGNGRAFCAGGDVKSLFLSSGVSDLKKEFLFKEYKLNYLIDQFNKPYLSIWNGIVMGVGVGLSIYGNVRIATENSKFAMPETAIGFFPDVGSSYFLSRIKNNFGLYLSLTGKIISFTEMIYLNLATHFCKSANIQKLESNYIHNGLVSPIDKIDKNSSELIDNKNFIEDTFHGDIFNIFKRLKKSNLEFAKITYQNLLKRCPMSLAVTAELFKKAKNLTLKECLEMEFQLSQKIVYRDDFDNGVESVLIKKNNNPVWKPNSTEEITNEQIDNLFEIHTDKLNL